MLDLCKRFGFDRRRQQARLGALGIDASLRPLCLRLRREVVGPHKEAVAQAFLRWLGAQEDAQRYLGDAQHDVLYRGLVGYLDRLGDVDADAAFEERLRVGLSHWMLDVPVSLFVCGHQTLQQLLLERVFATCSAAEAPAFASLVLRLMALDLTLVADTYRLAQVHHLVRSLKSQMDETHKFKLKATLDPLTGLPNRARVMELAEEALLDARSRRLSLCLVMLDIDHFKQVNDSYGHPAGDDVLTAVAGVMREALRGDDVIGRYGGEEFLIVLRAPRPDEFWSVAERVRLLVAAKPVVTHGHRVPVTVSQGLAVAEPQEALAALIGRADAALYEAKRQGRNRVLVAPPSR